MATETQADKVNSMLDGLAKVLKEPTISKFNKLVYKTPDDEEKTVFVYPRPVRTTKPFRGYFDKAYPDDILTDGGLNVVDLDFPQQLALFSRAADAWGIPARHGDLRENIEAVYGLKEEAYRRPVLDPFWVYTGQMAIKGPGGKVDVRRAMGAKFVDEEVGKRSTAVVVVDRSGHLIFRDMKISEETALQIRYVFANETLQTSFPTREGDFDDFSGAVPVDSDLKKKGRGHWLETYFENGLSAVRCDWNSDGRGLNAAADRPSLRTSLGALPIFADSLKK